MSITTPDSAASVLVLVNGDGHIYHQCDRTFRSNRGLNQHLRSCKQNTTTNTLDELETSNERNETTQESSKSYLKMALLLSGDINLNPGPFTRHQLKDPKFEAFKNKRRHLIHLNINSLLPKIDELHNIAKCSIRYGNWNN